MKNYLKSLETLLIEEKCHTVADSEAFARLHDLIDRDTAKAPERVSRSSSDGFFTVRDACPRCRIGFPYEVIITYCPNCGQRIRRT